MTTTVIAKNELGTIVALEENLRTPLIQGYNAHLVKDSVINVKWTAYEFMLSVLCEE